MARPRATVQFDQVAAALDHHGFGEVVALSELESGRGAFRVDLARGGTVVLKTSDDAIGTPPEREAFAAQLLSRLDRHDLMIALEAEAGRR